jgi:hypothetical protein
MTQLKLLKHNLLDRFLFNLVTRGWDQEAVVSYPERLHQHNALMSPEVIDAFHLIDGKATGLLTHASLMIAGLGLVAPLVVDNQVELGVVIAEIGVYLLIAVGCLRCLLVFHSRDFSEDAPHVQAHVLHELILRRELFSLCIRVAIVFTIVVFLVLPILYVWKPVK